MLSLFSANAAYVAPSLVMRSAAPTVRMETAADLESLAKALNPTVGYYDPLGLIKKGVENGEESTTIGWYRHAEIKHGRVAMAACVGFCVQSNGISFPWALTGGESPIMFSDIAAAGGPGDQWDALPTAAKMQIIAFVGLLELWSEYTGQGFVGGEKHYVYGGKPGYFPSFQPLRDTIGQPPLDLWDPFGFTKKMSAEKKEKALRAEINNGRLAMIGIFGFCSASKGLIVPGMDSIEGIKPYAGEYMAPFAASDSALPFVKDMLDFPLTFGNLVPNLY